MTHFTPEKINIDDATTARGGLMRKLAAGDNVAMRIWCNERPEDKEPYPHAHDYETVGYVIEGRARLHIEDESILLEPGDSWLVPSQAEHYYEILEEFTAIEATSPSWEESA